MGQAWFLGALPALIALAFLPGGTFYYDVVPKAAVLLAGTGLLSLWCAWNHKALLGYWTSAGGRWNGLLGMGAIVSVVLSAGADPLAWQGSAWRRWGAGLQIAAVIGALLASSVASRGGRGRDAILRGICVSGVVAAVYGCAQYLGIDPWLDSAAYRFGEGAYQIVRPPGPMGHANYLAAFLLWPVFCGLYLRGWLGWAAVVTGVTGIVVCGSRGALVGLGAGALVWLLVNRPRVRPLAVGVLAGAAALGAFYVSPWGEALRARLFWIGEDAAGGARLLLWRDSWRMAMQRPLLGFGPDTFAAQFPQVQSVELARAFPDFYHESPHNLFLDVLTGQGMVGVAVWLGWIGLACWAVWRAMRGEHRGLAGALAAGMAASLAAHQFAVLILPTGFLLLLAVGLISGLDAAPVAARRGWMAIPLVGLGLVCLAVGYEVLRQDAELAGLQAARAESVIGLWKKSSGNRVRADLALSRQWTASAAGANSALDKLRWAQVALDSARAAAQDPEQTQNGWYQLAILQGSANDAAGAEASLRRAAEAAPVWYKPHWTLARLLAATGRIHEAKAEARTALDLSGGKNAEVVQAMEEILRSPGH